MFKQKGNIFIAYDLVKEKEQSLGIMEKIDVEIIKIKEIEKLLLQGKISNAASIVSFIELLDYHKKNSNHFY